MARDIVQILPIRGAAPEGVGDYARLIAERLASHHAQRTTFVACTPLAPKDRPNDAWPTHTLETRRAAALLDTLEALGGDTPILLHLSAYGYHHRGTPFWLVRALQRWRRRNPATPLVTVFHELFATGPLWRKAFWIGPLQAHIARRVQAISTAGTTTTEPYADLLRRWRGPGGAEIVALPVFSTIGERDGPAAAARPPRLAIFARSDGIYRALPRIERVVAAYGIIEIVDIGHRSAPVPPRIGAATVRALGRLPADALSAELSRARFGLLDYDADRLAKSTVFAAYAAHGAIPLCLSDAAGTQDGLVPGANYLKPTTHDMAQPMTEDELESVQRGAAAWYRPHSLAHSASRFAAMLSPPSMVMEQD